MLSIQLDNRQRLIRQTKSALIYPAFVIFLSIVVAALLTILILPTLVGVMQDLVLGTKATSSFPAGRGC